MGSFGNVRASALNVSAVAMAAAHGITPRTVATWDPNLARTPRVLVPIQLDALVVRPQPGPSTWADCKMGIPPAGKTVQRKALLPPPFKNLDQPRSPGVYLHWALPDGLTQGTGSGAAVTFPAIPDRWLILRFYPSTIGPQRRGVKGWVLRAVDQNPVAIDLDQWKETGNEPGATDPPLTAVGFGDPAWATYYDNVVNRLGFYDNLADISSGPLAYLVCGWYSDPSLDPLGTAEVHSLTDFDSRMAQLGWELKPSELHEAVNRFRQFVKASTMLGLQTREAVAVSSYANAVSVAPPAAATSAAAGRTALTQFLPPAPQATVGSAPSPLDPSGHPVDDIYTTDGSWWPELTLYHGSVVGIGWPSQGWPGNDNGLLSGEVGGPPPAADIQVAVGNTMAEALAVLVARANAAPDEARVLEAFMLGGLRDLEQPDGQARVDALLHASAFASRDGGYVEEQIPQQALPPSTPPVPQGSVQPDGPGIFKQPSEFTRGRPIDVVAVKDATASAVSRIGSKAFVTKERFSEVSILKGGLAEAVNRVVAGPSPSVVPVQNRTVKRALPRFFQPSDPVILVQGGGRSFKHGGDGRFAEDGKLACRLTGFCVTELSCSSTTGAPIRPAVRGDDLLERGVENGSVPPECEDLLRETVLFDPGASVAAAQAATFTPTRVGTVAAGRAAAFAPTDLALARNFTVEQTVWWATRDPRVDPGPLVARSGIAGMLPSPIAVTPPVRPWTPIHLDWRIQFIPSANGASDWTLDETDFDPGEQKLPSPDDTQSGIILSGRAHLTGGAASTIAQGIRTALAQAASASGSDPLPANAAVRFNSLVAQVVLGHFSELAVQSAASLAGGAGATGGAGGGIPTVDRSVLGDIASTLENMDVLSGALDNFHTSLRGGYVGDGKTVPPDGSPTPNPFVPMRAGFMRILRLRLVDGYGQVADLAGSGETSLADSTRIVKSQPLELPNSPDFEVLPPRFTSPARLWFRYTAADGSPTDANSDVSPVCGYLMPNHLDGDLEFFGIDGTNLGVVRPDASAGIVWEEAPGQRSTVGQTPARAIPNQFLAGIAEGLIDWGLADAQVKGSREDALSALLRIIDSTLWAVDPFGHTGDEHLALLVGHPVVVLRARVRLEVQEPIAPDTVNQIAVPLRLGALTHWQDGLLGYFMNDDYRTLYCADAAVAGFAREVGPSRGFLQQINLVPDFYQTFSDDLGANVTRGNSPVNHPYVNDSGVRLILPNQEVRLTLLVEPQTVVHATAGLLPRKEIGMRREWIAAALAKLAPTFRFGPVLVDPKRIRMPVATELAGTWSWDARADVITWAEAPVINATTDAILPPDPATGTEGWLRLQPPPPGNGSGKTS